MRSVLDGKFTLKAAVLWATVPKEARARILASVFCPHCRDIVGMTKVTGKEKKGDVILKGACPRCGRAVFRIVETAERDSSVN
jgi:hypothetical protein